MLIMGFVFNGCEKDDPNTNSNSNSNIEEGCGDPEANNYDEDAEPCEDDECCEYCDSDNVAMFDASGDNTEISLTYGSIYEYSCYNGFCNKDINLSNDDGFNIYLELFYIDGGEFETSYVFGDPYTTSEPYFSDASDCMYNESDYYFEGGTVEIIANGDNTHEVIFMLNSDEGIEITGSYCGLLDEEKFTKKKARK